MSSTRELKRNEPSVMQQPSSPSVRIYWLNQDSIRRRLESAAKQMAAERPEIEEAWLFGSLARGDAVPGSDADLLLVLRESELPFLDRCAHYTPEPCGIGVDVLTYTRSEYEQMRTEGNPFLRSALDEGVCLFRRK